MTPPPGHRRIWPVLVAMTAACTAAAVWLGLRGNADASWWWLAGWLALATAALALASVLAGNAQARDLNEAVDLAAGIPIAAFGTIEVRPVHLIPTPP